MDVALSDGLGWWETGLPPRPRDLRETLRDRSLPHPRNPGKPLEGESFSIGEGKPRPIPTLGLDEADDLRRPRSSTEMREEIEGLLLPLVPRMDAVPVIEASMALPRAASQRFIS